MVAIHTRAAVNHCPRGWWSAPTGGNRCRREAAGIDVKRRDLHPVGADLQHRAIRGRIKNISTEFHTPQGPCVFVPLPGDRCSVVWVSAPEGSRAADGAER